MIPPSRSAWNPTVAARSGRQQRLPPVLAAASFVRRERSLLTTVLAWALLLYMTVPVTIFSAPGQTDDAYKTNSIARGVKLALLVLGLVVVFRRSALFMVLLRRLNPYFKAFLVVVPLSYLWSISPGDTIARYVTILSEISVCAAVCLAGWHKYRFQEITRLFITLIVVGSIIFGLLAPDLAIEHGEGTLKNSWHGLTAQKNEFGQLASFGVILWLHGGLAREVASWKAVLFGGASMVCVFLSRSSNSLLATVFSMFLLLLLLRSPPSMRRYHPYIVTFYAATVLIYALAVLRLVPGLGSLLDLVASLTGKDTTFSNRAMIWEIIKEHIRLSPYLGTGYGAYWIGPVPTSPSYTFMGRMYFYPTESHNGYLEIVNDLGFLGLGILIGYLVTFVSQALKVMRVDRYTGSLYLALFFQQAIMNLSESSWFTVNSAFLFAIMNLATLSLARTLLDLRLK